MDATFTVVELLGSTRAAPVHSTDADTHETPLARLTAAARAACEGGDVIAKNHGDSLVLASSHPMDGLALVRRLLDRLRRRDEELPCRIGMHHGEAIRHGGEWFGSAIAVATRVCGQARRGQVLATNVVASSAPEAGFETLSLGLVELRSVAAPLELFVLEPAGEDDGALRDPVCGRIVEAPTAAGWLRHAGQEHYFCSLDCAGAFAAHPARFTG